MMNKTKLSLEASALWAFIPAVVALSWAAWRRLCSRLTFNCAAGLLVSTMAGLAATGDMTPYEQQCASVAAEKGKHSERLQRLF